MRKVLPFAASTVLSVALLGFALLRGLQSVQPGEADDWPGWQVDAARWSCVGLALVLGLVVSVLAFRRLRRLQGAGLVLGAPLVLVGLLASGALSPAADAAQAWAARHTHTYREAMAQQTALVAEAKLHPLPVPMRNFQLAPADLAALLPTAAELGAGWYDGQRPLAVSDHDNPRSVRTGFTKATRIRDGWQFDRTLWVRLHEYGSPDQAAAWVATGERPPAGGPDLGRFTPVRVGGVVFSLRVTNGDSVLAYARRGARVWTVMLSSGQPDEPLGVAERDAVLEVVAARIA